MWPDESSEPAPTGAVFHTTHWSAVLAARQWPAPDAQEAMARLCRIYWPPTYAFLRRRGHPSHDAQELTQELFYRLLQTDFLKSVDAQKGKFRTFLLACLQHVVRGEWDKQRAAKRGGGNVISWDAVEAEVRDRLEPAAEATPESVFDQRWASVLINQVMNLLRREYSAMGKAGLFDELRPCLAAGNQPGGYSSAAERLQMSEGALRVAVLRLRRRFREFLRQEVAHTVADAAEVDAELRYLLTAWAG